MGMRLRVFLTSEEDRTLRELRRATTIPQRVKDRADVVRMSARGIMSKPSPLTSIGM